HVSKARSQRPQTRETNSTSLPATLRHSESRRQDHPVLPCKGFVNSVCGCQKNPMQGFITAQTLDLPEGPRRSKLSFVACQESTSLDQLKRVREPVSRSKAGVQGKIVDVMNGRSRHAESQNELKAFRIYWPRGAQPTGR